MQEAITMHKQNSFIRLVAVWLVAICVIVVAAAVSQASNAWLAAAIVVTSLSAGTAGALVALAWPAAPSGAPDNDA
jgi:multidrug efflux pump subunit AcrB